MKTLDKLVTQGIYFGLACCSMALGYCLAAGDVLGILKAIFLVPGIIVWSFLVGDVVFLLVSYPILSFCYFYFTNKNFLYIQVVISFLHGFMFLKGLQYS